MVSNKDEEIKLAWVVLIEKTKVMCTNGSTGNSIYMKIKKICKADNIMEQVAWRSCGVYIPGDKQNPTGHRHKPSTLGYPALRKGVGLGDLQSCLPTSKILWFHENIIFWY